MKRIAQMNRYATQTWTALSKGTDTRFPDSFVLRDENFNMADLLQSREAVEQRAKQLGIKLKWL